MTEELCPKCKCPIHPCLPCEEIIQFHNHVDSEYFDLLKLILEEGVWAHNRTGVDTLAVFGAQAKFDVDLDAFPILTTKKIHFKSIAHELLWFIRGDTNIKYLVDNGVSIWNEWAYQRYLKACGAEDCPDMASFIARLKELPPTDPWVQTWGDLGEGTYGGMWRAFPYFYEREVPDPNGTDRKYYHPMEGTVDQLKKVMDNLKNKPTDRRMIVSAWHPFWVDHCALPPCHCMFHFNTQELTKDERIAIQRRDRGDITRVLRDSDVTEQWLDDIGIPRRRLNLLLYQRSCDTFLGVPFNITSYCLLLAMAAHVSGMECGTFTHTYGDLHIYRNHMAQVDLQLGRIPKLLPKLRLNPDVKSLFDFKYEDIQLLDYDPHPAIKAEVAV